MRLDDLRPIALFDGLRDDQLVELVEGGDEVRFEVGTVVFREGDHADHWWVLVDGAIELSRHIGREDTVVGRMDMPGRWAGGFRAWDEHGVYLATGRGARPGRLLRLPAEALRERTSVWFPFGAHLVAGLYGTARSIESTARQRESLVTLGTLAAGLAHELNNPAAAATRAVDALEETWQSMLSSLGLLARAELPATALTALSELRDEVDPASAVRDTLALADCEDALSDWMARHDVDRDWELAPALAAAGVDVDWCERAAAILGSTALQPGLEWVAGTFSSTGLLAEVKDSTRRISELVAAVRSYSQMDRSSMQRVDVTDGLESTLVMLRHKLRDGVEVIRDYGTDLPMVDAYAGELNQVWTNLIDNAVDAMDGSGTLRLTTRSAEDAVVVEVADTGPGMPPEVAARAFEAFYTTKDVGKGTGLGLDIARRIVADRHGGTITIDSDESGAVLRVLLPVRPPAR